MKKITSIILLIAMLSSVCVLFSGCEWGLSDEKLLQMKQDYIEQFEIEDKRAEDVLLEFYAGNFHGYEVVMLDAGHHSWLTAEKMYCDEEIFYYDENRIFAYMEGSFYSLEECVENELLSETDFFFISKRYDADIKGYYDVIDDYDYTWVDMRISVPNYSNDEEYRIITVYMYPGFNQSGPDVPLAYFGKHFFSKIKDPIDAEAIEYNKYVGKAYDLILRHPGKENYLAAIEHLKTVNGIHCINTTGVLATAGALPDDYPNLPSKNWGLEMINVEKVWDFTTGNDDVRVAVVRM